MKKVVLVFLIFSFYNIIAQTSREIELKKQLDKAVANQDYEQAAKLKEELDSYKANKSKIIELEREIDKAVANQDYQKAADLKKQIDAISQNGSKIAELEEKIKVAVANGEYEKAANLKDEIETLKSGKTVSSSTSNSTSKSSSSYSSTNVDPEFVNQVYVIKSGNLSQLEKHKGQIKTKTGASPFYAQSTSFYFVQGTHSNTIVSSDSKFCVKVFEGIDPSDQFTLIKFEHDRNGNDRWMPYYKSTSAFYAGESKRMDSSVSVNFKKIKDNVFEIIPSGNLASGEYAFWYIDNFFCFSVK